MEESKSESEDSGIRVVGMRKRGIKMNIIDNIEHFTPGDCFSDYIEWVDHMVNLKKLHRKDVAAARIVISTHTVMFHHHEIAVFLERKQKRQCVLLPRCQGPKMPGQLHLFVKKFQNLYAVKANASGCYSFRH